MQRIAVQENEANRSLQARTLQVRTDIAQPRLNVKNAGRVIWLSIAKGDARKLSTGAWYLRAASIVARRA